MISELPSPTGGALIFADTLEGAWTGVGAAALAHRSMGHAVVIWVTEQEPALQDKMRKMEVETVTTVPEFLSDTAHNRSRALAQSTAKIEEKAITRIFLSDQAPEMMRAVALEVARRSGVSLWLFSATTPVSPTHQFSDPDNLEQKHATAACLPERSRRQMRILEEFYGLHGSVAAAEGLAHRDQESLHRHTPRTLISPPERGNSSDAITLVSVIIRSMERSSLADALESVACQTWPVIEVVVVNARGGTHFQPVTARQELAIRVENQEGPPLTRPEAANAGLRSASGQYALFLDDDDLLYPSHLETLIRVLEASPVAVAAYSGTRVEAKDPSGDTVKVSTLNEPFDRRRLVLENFLPIHSLLFDLSRAREHGCHFDEDLELYEDWDFFLQLSEVSDFIRIESTGAVYQNFQSSGLNDGHGPRASDCRERLYNKWLHRSSGSFIAAVLDYAREPSNPWIHRWKTACEQSQQQGAKLEQELQAATEARAAAEAHARDAEERRQRELTEAQNRILALENHLHFMRTSTSWRATRPLRLVRIIARNGARAGARLARIVRDHGKPMHLVARTARSVRRYGWKTTRERALMHLGLSGILSDTEGAPPRPLHSAGVDPSPPTAPPPLEASHPPVDIIVCVHNALDDVRRCLESVLRHTPPPYRLIIVDDGSDNPTREFTAGFCAEQDHTVLLRNDQAQGYTRAANRGMREAGAEFVVLLNSDTVVSEEWLPRMLRCMEMDPSAGMAGPLSNTASWQSIPEIEDAGDWAMNPLPHGWTIPDMAEATARFSQPVFPRLPFLNGFCLLLRHKALEEVGLFDEETFAQGYGEENDFSLRLAKAQWSLAVVDDVYVYHAQSRSYSNERRRKLGDRAALALARKHDPVLIDRNVQLCRESRSMAGTRARSTMFLHRLQALRDGHKRFAGRSVLFVLPAADAGGGSNVIMSEARRMLEMGVDVAIANLAANRESFGNAYADNPVPVHYVKTPDELPAIARGFDAAVASIYYTVTWLAPLAGTGTSLGYYIQDYEPHWFQRGSREHREATDSYTLLPGLRLFCKTQWNRRAVVDQTGAACSAVGPSVELNLFRPRRERNKGQRIVIAAMVRPQSEYRSPTMTMRLLARIKRNHPDQCEIITFGTDRHDPALQRIWPDAPIGHLGKLTSPQLASVLDQSDVFTDFSTYQAMGLTAMEAMACGLATIVPEQGAATEFARHEHNALVVDSSDEEACYQALERLLLDRELRERLAQQALADIQQYPPETVALNILEALFPEIPAAPATKPVAVPESA